MRIADCDILLMAGTHSEPDHWMARWESRLPNAQRAQPAAPNPGDFAQMVANLVALAESATRPIVVIAHSCGVIHTVKAAPWLSRAVRAAFLVGPVDLDSPDGAALCDGASSMPLDPLPFPSLLVASRTDRYCSFGRAESFATAWQSLLIDAGDAGHLDAESGRGPWPEGLLLLSRLLRNIGSDPLAPNALPA
jgi:hypothetical protein